MNRRFAKGFALIELLVTLLIISALLIFALEEYRRHIASTRITRARADIDELVKAVRLYNIKESRQFETEVFSPQALGTFIGTYLEKEPPRDPWGVYYLHDVKQGVVFSCGPDGKPQTTNIASESDDIAVYYLPQNFFVTRAEYVDVNLNNLVDISDYIELTFSRPAQLKDPLGIDFETDLPKKALGSAVVKPGDNYFKARIDFAPPIAPTLVPGQTKLFPREYIESIVDYSPKPQRLGRVDNLVIEKRKK